MTDVLSFIISYLSTPACRVEAPLEGRWRLHTVYIIHGDTEEMNFQYEANDPDPELYLLEFRGDTIADFVYCPANLPCHREFIPYTFDPENGLLLYKYTYQRILNVTRERLELLDLDGIASGVLQHCIYTRIG